jgi:hypothetical protein
MKTTFKILAMAVLLLFACLSASATLTTYSSQSTFDSNVTNKVTTTFEGESAIYGIFPLVNTCFADSTNVSCIVINAELDNGTPSALFLTSAADRAALPTYYDWGTGDLAQGSYPPGFDEFLPNSPFFGLDLMTLLGYGGSVNICVTTQNSGEPTCYNNVATNAYSNSNPPAFWGITSDGDLITKVTVTGSAPEYVLFDNVQYQFIPQQQNPIPEPASLVLFGSGILAAASKLRKRVKR